MRFLRLFAALVTCHLSLVTAFGQSRTVLNNPAVQTDINMAGHKLTSVAATVLADWGITNAVTTADLTNYVLATRTVNGHPLSANVTVSKSDVGLPNVDNTSDANKPVSTATQTALDLKVNANGTIVSATKTKITYDAKGLVTSGADATTSDIAEGSNLYYTNARAIAAPLTGYVAGAGTITSTDSVLVGIQKNAGNIAAIVTPANTTAAASNWFTAYNSGTGAFTKARPAIADLSDAGQLSAWAAITPATGVGTFIATPTLANLKTAITDETAVGWNLLTLANPGAITFLQLNADNSVTAQNASAQRTALGATTVGANIFQLANPGAISFVKIAADNSVSTRTPAQVLTDILGAPLVSPTFTGVPAAPTAAVDTNTTQVATTGFVIAQAAAANPVIDGTAAPGTATRYARADHVHPTDTTRAPLVSPTFTGTVTLPSGQALVAPVLGTPASGNASNLTNINASNISSGTLAVARGGTGASTLTAHGVVIGEGTSAVAITSAGTAGQVLTSNGASADPTFQTPAGGGGGPGYLVYAALLNQSGTSAPTATVLANTLGGTVVWTRSDVGEYIATLASAFPVNKVSTIVVPAFDPTAQVPSDYTLLTFAMGARDTNDTFVLKTRRYDPDNPGLDGALANTFIEIRVYP